MYVNTEIQIENHENIILYIGKSTVLRPTFGNLEVMWAPNFLKLTGPHSNPEAHIISNKKYRGKKIDLKILNAQILYFHRSTSLDYFQHFLQSLLLVPSQTPVTPLGIP
jgi:hypothetical protein